MSGFYDRTDYPVYHSSDFDYVGIAYPWYVIEVKSTRDSCPERRLLAYLKFINDVEDEELILPPLLPINSYPKKE